MNAPPLAYFLTFHTYGTWLPGDSRVSVRRGDAYGAPYRTPCVALEARAVASMQTPPVVLGDDERLILRRVVEDVCHHRSWTLHAVHARSNHVHTVVGAPVSPGRALGDLKAWGTRRVVEAGHRPHGVRLWARGGSVRHLWDDRAVSRACFYVLHEQGDVLHGAVSPAP